MYCPEFEESENFEQKLDFTEQSLKQKNSVHRGITVYDCDRMEGHKFEHTCADVLSANGFSNVSVTKASGDYGIDVLAEKSGKLYAIQCKCYSSPIGNHAVEEAFAGAAYYDGRIPVVMTNQTFTTAAVEMASRIGVILWDRSQLEKYLLVYESDEQRRIRTVKKVLKVLLYFVAAICALSVLFLLGSLFVFLGAVVLSLFIISIPLSIFMPKKRRRRYRR